MRNKLQVTTIGEGQCNCPACGSPLPAHETWPGATLRYCGSPRCTEELRKHDNGRYVAPESVRCDADECDRWVPEGFYGPYASFLCCSASCWQTRRAKRQEKMLCACGCKEEVPHRLRSAMRHQSFVSNEHYVRHKHEVYFERTFGSFRPLVEDYITNYAELHYRDLTSVRSSLGRFFRFLNESGCRSLDDVNCDTITNFLVWVHRKNRGVKSDLLSCITTFFKWLEMTGKRKAGCPVNKFLHRHKKPKRLPRPLSNDELRLAWKLLDDRGDARLRLAFAIGEEAGLRIGEICRLHVSDIDLRGRWLLVRLPNKGYRERHAMFGEKTATRFQEWMSERDSSCGHEMLLYNYSRQRTPFTQNSLAKAFRRVLCKTYPGRVPYDQGFDKWSTHRLRHTMATRLVAGGADAAVVIAAGGWIDPDTMAGYVEVDEAQAGRGYHLAMRTAKQQLEEAPQTRVLSLKEFREWRSGAIPAQTEIEQHCV